MLGESNTVDGKFTYAPVRFFDCTFVSELALTVITLPVCLIKCQCLA